MYETYCLLCEYCLSRTRVFQTVVAKFQKDTVNSIHIYWNEVLIILIIVERGAFDGIFSTD